MTTVTRTYLAMETPQPFSMPAPTIPGLSLTRPRPCPVALYRALYESVGRDYHWTDRTKWTDEVLASHLASSNVAVWVLREGDEPAGFFELARHDDGSVEIAYFGLAPSMIGRGVGKWLLARAAEEAWQLQPTRVWLHTCTLDHPSALANYVARGFAPYKRETYELAT